MNFLTELRDINVPESIITQILEYFGGCPVYVPKANKLDVTARNAEICRRFNGKNHADLCRKYDLSYQQVCKILKAGRR